MQKAEVIRLVGALLLAAGVVLAEWWLDDVRVRQVGRSRSDTVFNCYVAPPGATEEPNHEAK